MDIQRSEMKILSGDKVTPVNVDSIDEGKKMLVNNSKFKTICFNFEEGKGLPDHVHNGYATILIYDGEVDIKFENGEEFNLKKGDFLPFDARIKHNVIATVKSKVLVTISESLS